MSDRDALSRLLRAAGDRPELNTARKERLKSAVRPVWRTCVSARRRWRAAWTAAALAAAGLVAFVAVEMLPGPAPIAVPTPAGVLEAFQGPVAVAPGGRLEDSRPAVLGQVIMVDDKISTGDALVALRTREGASLRLDRTSTMTFLGPRRLALERGALYLDSEGAETGSFLVETVLGLVEDVGTQFEVRLLGSSLRVRVREGEVVLRGERGELRGRRGEEVRVGPDASLRRRTVSVTGPEWQWMMEAGPSMNLALETLESYLRWVAREGGYELEFVDGELALEARLRPAPRGYQRASSHRVPGCGAPGVRSPVPGPGEHSGDQIGGWAVTRWAAWLAILALAAWPLSRAAAISAGQPLLEALEELKDSGLRLIYSSALVTEDLQVASTPTSDVPREALAEILAPHGLAARPGPGGRLVVIRSGQSRATGSVKGRVEDVPEAHLPEIRIVVVGIAKWVAVDRAGGFEVRDLSPGRYRIEALWRGATVGVLDDVEVRSGETTDAVIRPPGAGETEAPRSENDERGDIS